jgi:ribosome biogenesis protein MAK21
MVKKSKSAPPAAFVAGLGVSKKRQEESSKLGGRVAAARNALDKVKANSQASKGDRRAPDGSKSSKKEWWMRYQPPPSGTCLISLNEDTTWHSLIEGDKNLVKNGSTLRLEKLALQSLTQRVKSAFIEEVNKYEKRRSTSSSNDQKMMDDMIKAGTLSDKIAAMALRVQESPLHQLDTLDALIHLASKSEQRTANLALEAIRVLFTHTLLPDRHLVRFEHRPLAEPDLDMSRAMLFYFEDQLIKRVSRVLDALEMGLRSNLEFFKKQCMETVAALLTSKPEQEARLLVLLTNKLGDPASNVCSKCIDLLKALLRKHSAMKQVVIGEVHQLILRPGIPTRTIYNGIVFLSQVPLTTREGDVASLLLEGYLSLFERTVSTEELRSRLLAALLAGINRAFPFLGDSAALLRHTDALFKIVHSDSFSSATQALTLISHLVLAKQVRGQGLGGDEDDSKSLSARYYRALYSKLLSESLLSRARNTMFLNLLFKSIKRDPSDLRAAAFLKRLAICATNSSPNITAGYLLLISETCRVRPELAKMMTEEEATPHAGEESEGEALGPFIASKREPMYATSSMPSLWEATLLRQHCHPSVSKFAVSLLQKPHIIEFKGDPITDFTLSAFLNRFAFKNPKLKDSKKIRRALPTPEQPLNNAEFVQSSISEVDGDKRFFHRFFGQRLKLRSEGKSRDRSKRRRVGDPEDSLDESDDDDGEDMFSPSGVDSGDEMGSVDAEEEEIDKYADSLAEKLMRDHAKGDDNPDMDDFSEESLEDDDDSEEVEDSGENEDDSYEGRDSIPFLQEGEGDDESSEGEFDEPIAKLSKKRASATKSKRGAPDSVFAAYSSEYEDQMEQIMEQVRGGTPIEKEVKKRRKN